MNPTIIETLYYKIEMMAKEPDVTDEFIIAFAKEHLPAENLAEAERRVIHTRPSLAYKII